MTAVAFVLHIFVGIVAVAVSAVAFTAHVGTADSTTYLAAAEPPTPTTFSLTARQADEVSAVTQFVAAFNSRQLRKALALLSASPGVSDCDFRRVRAVQFSGRRAVARWLQARFVDRDRLTIAKIYNENAEQPTGVVAVEYARRTSNTLRAIGFPAGIVPRLATKVVLTPGQPPRISQFANGPGPIGGSADACRPQ